MIDRFGMLLIPFAQTFLVSDNCKSRSAHGENRINYPNYLLNSVILIAIRHGSYSYSWMQDFVFIGTVS